MKSKTVIGEKIFKHPKRAGAAFCRHQLHYFRMPWTILKKGGNNEG